MVTKNTQRNGRKQYFHQYIKKRYDGCRNSLNDTYKVLVIVFQKIIEEHLENVLGEYQHADQQHITPSC